MQNPAPTASRRAAWLQFPRRVLLLLIAYAVCAGLLLALRGPLGSVLAPDFFGSAATGQPVAELVGERLRSTLLLLGAALALALPFAALGTLLAVGLRRLRAGLPAAGVGAGCLARLVVYGVAAVPPFVLALIAIYVLGIWLGLLPGGSLFGPPSLVRIPLPALLLALFPALVASQAATRALLGPGVRARRLGRAALELLGALAAQTGGLLSALLVVENVFAWPGLGRLLVEAASRRDPAVFVGVLLAFASIVVAARLLAELFFAAGRLVGAAAEAEPAATTTPVPLRRVGLGVSLALLLVPLALLAAGLLTPADRALEMSPADRLLAPSAEHPWGTDSLGRDLRARVLRGALTTLGMATAAALLATVPAGLLGALTSRLARRGQLVPESLADLLLLPADIWLLLPAVPAAILLAMLFEARSVGLLWLAAAVVLLPRAWRAAHQLWSAAPAGLPGGRRVALGIVGIFLTALFAGLWLLPGLDMLGLGVPPPTPSLGALLTDGMGVSAQQPAVLLAPSFAIWLCAFALYAAASAVLGMLWGKAAAGWFNA